MRTDQTFGVNFIVRSCKEDKKTAFIYVKISVDGGLPKEISLKEKININDWDWKAKVVKGRSQDVKRINEYIDEVRVKIRHIYRDLDIQDQIITAEIIKQRYLGKQADLKRYTLLKLLEEFRNLEASQMDWGNKKNYNTTISYVKLFLNSSDPATHQPRYVHKDVFLPEINMEFATRLQSFIPDNPIKAYDKCKGNGLAKHMQRFKRIMNYATDDLEWITFNPIGKFKCGVKKTRRIKLTLDQVFTLEFLPGLTGMIAYVRDLFVFSCYTGLAFADVMQLCPHHIEVMDDVNILCKIHREKSEELAAVPFLGKACELIRQYWNANKAKDGGAIFPAITNQ